MIETQQLIEHYSWEGYTTYNTCLSEEGWGNKDVAKAYLDKYYISEDEYSRQWKLFRDAIFINQNKGLPELVFSDTFRLIATQGGVLFTQEDFEDLQKCILALGDKYLIIIQNTFGKSLNVPPLRMKYPSDITWDQLMGGNFIFTALFEMFKNEYFVFSESCKWGKYSANDFENPLDIIGFKPEYKSIFKENFKQPKEEWEEIKASLPTNYKKLM